MRQAVQAIQSQAQSENMLQKMPLDTGKTTTGRNKTMSELVLTIRIIIDEENYLLAEYNAHPGILFTGGRGCRYYDGIIEQTKQSIINSLKKETNRPFSIKYTLIDRRQKQVTLTQFL
jgi:hypothetical protein